MCLADYAVDYTPEELADIACEMFMDNVYTSPPFIIFILLMPILTIALSFCKRKLWGLMPSICIGIAVILQTVIMLFKTSLFYGIRTEPMMCVHSYSGYIYFALFHRLFRCLVLFFAIHYGFPVLKRHVQHRREIRRYMKFKREQDKQEGKNT